MSQHSRKQIARVIDHSLLHPTMTDAHMETECHKAAEWQVAAVCVKPHFVGRASEIVEGSDVAACTTVGFPHGGHAISTKVGEARTCTGQGAQEDDFQTAQNS